MATNKQSNKFIKEVAKYFMDFLETDFHKRRNPKRSVQTRNKDNLLVGLNLNKYPDFQKIIRKAFAKGFPDGSLKIERGVYKTSIPENLLELIELQIGRISKKQIIQVLKRLAEAIEDAAVQHKKEVDKAQSVALESCASILREELINPFVSSIEKPLENIDLGDENSIYLMEEELTNILLSLIESRCLQIVNYIVSNQDINIEKQLKEVFEEDAVKVSISDFFDAFKVTDLFNEIFEMDRNRLILDKQEFYFYFYDVSFRKTKYPLFYIPFTISRDKDILNIEFDSQLYINKKALEFIVQEYNAEKGKRGSLKTVAERIIYLAEHGENLHSILEQILSEITNFFELDESLDVRKQDNQAAKSLWVRMTNACSIALFDKSDEALVNDYEDILGLLDSVDNPLGEIFNRLIDDFVQKEPRAFHEEIDDEWDEQGIGDKLAYPTPVPLNSEQRQILSAIKKEGCNYITVEGPPGTGKSHTITAIVCDAILNDQSVLVLSDKKEALDVVEDKITSSMDKVRHDKDFQNPILRLGKAGSTYAKILSNASIDRIKNHYRAVKKEHGGIDEAVQKRLDTLKEDLEAETLTASEIDLGEIVELHSLEPFIEEQASIVDLHELLDKQGSAIDLQEIRDALIKLRSMFYAADESQKAYGQELLDAFGLSVADFSSLEDYHAFYSVLEQVQKHIEKVKESYGAYVDGIGKLSKLDSNAIAKIEKFLQQYSDIRNPVLGFLMQKEAVFKLDSEFKREIGYADPKPHKHLKAIRHSVEVLKHLTSLSEELKSPIASKMNYLQGVRCVVADKSVGEAFAEMVTSLEDLRFIEQKADEYPKTYELLGIQSGSLEQVLDNDLIELDEENLAKIIRYISLRQKITTEFNKLGKMDYINDKSNIEDLVTAQMTYLMDAKLIKFYYNNQATAKTIKGLIQKKQRFPKDEFAKLKEAFPCILAGIRDYAEYIPLEPEIFDLVIIDEASQVSIAQAFPALLRAKKVLILGDRKQFSNVKASHARTDTNREYIANLRRVFTETISKDDVKLAKLDKFNIKTSILDFFEFIHNFNIQLKKHFRGYKENIGYSNKFFYQESLEVMKIRAKPINEVLKFSVIEHDGKAETVPNTNMPEIDFVVSELESLKKSKSKQSVGIITPHTNQQKRLVEKISKHPDSDWFFSELKLKIMTFDTCQGEERDIIYYPMVATKDSDRLWGIFISDLSKQDLEEQGNIKAQRLNVGFSRAKECMHFVLSKEIEEFNGSIGEALRHYSNALEEGRQEKTADDVDPSSPMEAKVLHWFYQTDFWKKNKDSIEFNPQFELGKYLKQLDMNYSHPNYKVDFLLVYRDEKSRSHHIVIEYDGFDEHFGANEQINEFNIGEYYGEQDLYREKVLESYGYKFLRINKFTVGEDPIQTLDERIKKLVSVADRDTDALLSNIHQTVEGLENGDMKECPKCRDVKSSEDFKDPRLISGYGRICRSCKAMPSVSRAPKQSKPVVLVDKQCPKCSSQMVLRKGRYGEFYGCKRFPYCRGTRQKT